MAYMGHYSARYRRSIYRSARSRRSGVDNRPTCPQCGSPDLDGDSDEVTCNDCGHNEWVGDYDPADPRI